jgi:hypothetical protein
MSALGQSRPSHLPPKSADVRFAPIATISHQNAIRRSVPMAEKNATPASNRA